MGEHQDEEYKGNPGNHASAGHVEWTGQGARSDGGVRGGGRGGGACCRGRRGSGRGQQLPKGSLATSAIGSYVGVAVPVGAEGPSGAGSAAEAVGNSGTTSEVPMFGELVGRACYQRNGGTATMRPPGPATRSRGCWRTSQKRG